MAQEVGELRNPRLHIGQLEVPAIVVPIAITGLFIAYKIYERNHLRPSRRPPPTPDSKSADVEEAKSQPFPEPQTPTEPTGKMETIVSIVWITGFALCQITIMFWPWRLPTNLIMSILVFNLFTTLVGYIVGGPPRSRMQSIAVSAAAAGPLIQIARGSPPPWPWAFAALMSVLAIVSWWPSTPRDEASLCYMVNGTVLLAFELSTNVMANHWPEELFSESTPPVWWSLLLASPLVLLMLWWRVCKWFGCSPLDKEHKAYSTRHILKDILAILLTILGMGIFLGAWVSVQRVTSFASSCIGFGRLFGGKPDTTSPIWDNFIGTLALAHRMILMITTREFSTPFSQLQPLRNCADAIGWSVTGSLSLGLVLMAIEQVRIWT